MRLGDVARVEMASAEHRSLFRGNGETMVGMGIVKQSTSNALSVSRGVGLSVCLWGCVSVCLQSIPLSGIHAKS